LLKSGKSKKRKELKKKLKGGKENKENKSYTCTGSLTLTSSIIGLVVWTITSSESEKERKKIN